MKCVGKCVGKYLIYSFFYSFIFWPKISHLIFYDENITLEGTVSKISDLGPSFYFI